LERFIQDRAKNEIRHQYLSAVKARTLSAAAPLQFGDGLRRPSTVQYVFRSSAVIIAHSRPGASLARLVSPKKKRGELWKVVCSAVEWGSVYGSTLKTFQTARDHWLPADPWHVMKYYAHFGHKASFSAWVIAPIPSKIIFVNYDEYVSNDLSVGGGKNIDLDQPGHPRLEDYIRGHRHYVQHRASA